jgi:Xaa-Pro aminopeptidase
VVTSPPFDTARLDALLGERGLAALLATSPHSTQHLLGGYRFFLYDKLPSIGLTRYVPVLGYVAGRPDVAFYVGAGNEDWGTTAAPIWPEVHNVAWGAADAAAHAADLLRRRRLDGARIGIESAYLPAEAYLALRTALPEGELVDAADLLEELRAVKRADELELIRRAARANVDSMLATFQAIEAGQTTAEIVDRLRAEQTARGLDFAYCLIAAGPRHDRAPAAQPVEGGEIVSLDSGTSYRGYVADCVRMGVLGEPTSRMVELLAEVDAVQQAVRAAIGAGRRGGDLFAVADEQLARTPSRDHASFLVHGTGLLTHEAPRLTATGSPPYPAAHADRPLLAGMVLSVETHIADPDVGFVKLEDTVVVTQDGAEAVGDHGRGWNVIAA